MLFPSKKNKGDLEKLELLVSLGNQIQALTLQHKTGKQNFHEDVKKVFEPVTKSVEDVSEEETKSITKTSKENNKALENLNDILLETMNDRGTIASCLLCSPSKNSNPANTSQNKLIKGPSLNRINELLKNKTIPVTVHDKLLTFRDTVEKFELQGVLLNLIPNKKYNVDLSNSQDENFCMILQKKCTLKKKL